MEHEIILIKVIVQYRVLEVLKLFLFLTTWTYRNMAGTLPSGRAFAMGTCHGFWGWEWTNYIIYTASSTSWSSSMLEALQGYGFQAVSSLFIFKRFIIHCLQFGFRFHLLKKKNSNKGSYQSILFNINYCINYLHYLSEIILFFISIYFWNCKISLSLKHRRKIKVNIVWTLWSVLKWVIYCGLAKMWLRSYSFLASE